ncbi:MAG: indole-3-glycerol-phosphate synthase [Gemmatimonadales bacterium]
MGGFLAGILRDVRDRVRDLRTRMPELERDARGAPRGPSWETLFSDSLVGVMAEVKRRSPSAGEISLELDPARLARAYERGGAGAISVLTEEPHFGGSLGDLRAVRQAVGLPVLWKDFLLDPLQLCESRLCGASAVLLVARVLEGGALAEMVRAAEELGLATLVEVHRVAELERALDVRPQAVGVNARDLDTFEVDVKVLKQVLGRIPSGVKAVAESGLSGRADVERVAAWGADAVLVGTALVESDDPEARVRELVGVPRVGR